MTSLFYKIGRKRELFILVLMLEMLHLSIWVEFGSIFSRSLMLSHLGLFLLWQPVWRGDEKLTLENTSLFIVFTLTFTFWLNPWLCFAWLILLIGFVSGRMAFDRNERRVYILAIVFLVAELLFACMPMLADIKLEKTDFFIIYLPLIPVLILFFPPLNSARNIQSVDFIHAITTSMLASIVALGSLLNMFLSQTSYISALAQSLTAIGGFILLISWLLTSRTRFSAISQLWSSYMLNIGTPFEQWLSDLSRLNEKDISANDFLHEAMQKLLEFNWISGVQWTIKSDFFSEGKETSNSILIEEDNSKIVIYTYSPAGAALKFHCNLLIRLLNNFYLNKLRENELTKQAHLKAIYETGARITHDIKNLLQSFQAITSIITHDSAGTDNSTVQQILRRQLPNLTQRLQLALDKLQTPEIQDSEEIYLKDWWNDLKKRNSHKKIIFQADIDGDPLIPVDLFDSVIDNLLENAQTKVISEPSIEITVSIVYKPTCINLVVCDTGSKIPERIANDLLKNAIKSDNGLGIGLYQANIQAEKFGYKLSLKHNQDGRVCFEFTSNSINSESR